MQNKNCTRSTGTLILATCTDTGDYTNLDNWKNIIFVVYPPCFMKSTKTANENGLNKKRRGKIELEKIERLKNI